MALTRTSSIGLLQHENDVLSKVKLMIRNQFPGIELVSSVYVHDHETYSPPYWSTNAGSTVQAIFNIDASRYELLVS
jgi:hypothetical protein